MSLRTTSNVRVLRLFVALRLFCLVLEYEDMEPKKIQIKTQPRKKFRPRTENESKTSSHYLRCEEDVKPEYPTIAVRHRSGTLTDLTAMLSFVPGTTRLERSIGCEYHRIDSPWHRQATPSIHSGQQDEAHGIRRERVDFQTRRAEHDLLPANRRRFSQGTQIVGA